MAELIQREDSLNTGREKLNEAIKASERAEDKSDYAVETADTALINSESTQTQLDTIVIDGDSSVEAAQARVDKTGNAYTTLKERLDTENAEVTSQLAESSNNNKPSWSVWEEFERRGVNVDWYGAAGDGVSNDTDAFISANAISDTIILSKGKTYCIQNFIPNPGTVIISEGATVSRYNSDIYEETGSSSSIIITNENIQILGGVWTDLVGKDSWSGSILVESGSLRLDGAIIENSWGGVFGHQSQNQGRIASYVTITNCEFRNCSHNTYLADIENFSFSNNRSHHSSRDGLRTHRNVRNIVITNNHIYNNGNGNPNQSQDAIDLFFSGYKCIIKDNFLYNCDFKGIDIKHSPDAAGETIINQEFVIEGNFIFNNANSGIEIQSTVGTFIENVSIINNRIYENGLYGIRMNFGDVFQLSKNQVYRNGRDGIRIDNVVKGGIVSGNITYDNGTDSSASTKIGIFIVGTALNVDVYNNKCYSNGEFQEVGIEYNSNGICKDNDCRNNLVNNYNGSPPVEARGDMSFINVKSGETTVPLSVSRDSILSNLVLTVSGTGTFHVQLSKRKLDGGYETLLYDKDVTITSGYKTVNLSISGLGTTARGFKKNQNVLVSITTVSGTFTHAQVGFEFLH